MLRWFKAKAQYRRTAGDIYGAVVAAARTPAYYSALSVPDTPEGRFDMVALTMFLVLEPLKSAGAGGTALAQGVIEAFVQDMDDCMREMGVGDLTVPKKVKRAAAAFYERAGAYRAALSVADDSALSAALQRYVYQGKESVGLVQLTAKVRATARALNAAGDGVAEPVSLRIVLDSQNAG